MGTEITLDIGGVNLTYSKNYIGIDHGSLFQEKDRKRCRSDQINYDYFEQSDEEPAKMEMAFVRTLGEIATRLKLLGFTLNRAKHEYKKLVDELLEEYEATEEDFPKEYHDYMTFEEFVQFATEYSILELDDTFISGADEKSESKIRGRFYKDGRTKKIPFSFNRESGGYSEANYFGNLVEILHPYSVLCILSENKNNLNAEVIWQYGPLVENGWAKQEEFIPNAKRNERFLIATEGVSDTRILKHALSILKPEIQDFFAFIDIEEGHPFSGVGNLVNFARGLIKIDVQNKVVFLFDNDAVGFESYNKLVSMKPPSNIRGVMLPELGEFHDFLTKGPEGIINSDINRRAASIECYLDLESGNENKPLVIWKNYIKSIDMYHGSLDRKENYENEFLKQNLLSISNGSYDTKKIMAVLDTLIFECQNIATGILNR